MNITAKDFEEAWKITKAFLDNTNETQLMLCINTEPSISNYIIVKVPFGETISLLYCPAWGSLGPGPGYNLNYAGFYSSRTEKVYDMQDNSQVNWFYKFGIANIYRDNLEKTIIEAIQKAVAEHIASHAEEFSGLSISKDDGDITGYAEKAFSVQETVLDFAARISVDKWRIHGKFMIEYVDNPEEFLKNQVNRQIKDQKEELARLWAAHCASQKILDLIYTQYILCDLFGK
jgi:hypothetical protein